MNASIWMEQQNAVGCVVILVISLAVNFMARGLSGNWVPEHVLVTHFMSGAIASLLWSRSQLRPSDDARRAEYVEWAKRKLWAQAVALCVYTSAISWFASIFIYPMQSVSVSGLVRLYSEHAMSWIFPVVVVLILIPFTIAMPLGIIFMNGFLGKVKEA